jgi:hypothetical protein
MIQPGKPIRIALAIFLIVALTMWLTGCIYIPLWGYAKNADGFAASKQLGPADSHKPLRVTSATRQQVMALFGYPDLTSHDSRAIGYTKLSAPNWLVIGLCWGIYDRDYYLFLEFDDHNVLRRYRLVGGNNQPNYPILNPYLPTFDEIDPQPAWDQFLGEMSHPTIAPAPPK